MKVRNSKKKCVSVANCSKRTPRIVDIDATLAAGGCLGNRPVVCFGKKYFVKRRLRHPRPRGMFCAAKYGYDRGEWLGRYKITLSTDKKGMRENRHLFTGDTVAWKKGVTAHLHHPTTTHIAQLANGIFPGDDVKAVNAEMRFNYKSPISLSLFSTRSIAYGEEVVTTYGEDYHETLLAAQAEAERERKEIFVYWERVPGNWFKCPLCGIKKRTVKEKAGHMLQCKG